MKKSVVVTFGVVGAVVAAALVVFVLERMGVIPSPPFLTGAEAAVRIGTHAMPPPGVNLQRIHTGTRSWIDRGVDLARRGGHVGEAIAELTREKFNALIRRGVLSADTRVEDLSDDELQRMLNWHSVRLHGGAGATNPLAPLETISSARRRGAAYPPLETL